MSQYWTSPQVAAFAKSISRVIGPKTPLPPTSSQGDSLWRYRSSSTCDNQHGDKDSPGDQSTKEQCSSSAKKASGCNPSCSGIGRPKFSPYDPKSHSKLYQPMKQGINQDQPKDATENKSISQYYVKTMVKEPSEEQDDGTDDSPRPTGS